MSFSDNPAQTMDHTSSLPEKIYVFGTQFEEYRERTGTIKASYVSEDREKFIQLLDPYGATFEERVIQGVTGLNSKRKISDQEGIEPITDYELRPIILNEAKHVALYGDFVAEKDNIWHDIPPELIGDYEDMLQEAGEIMYDLMLEGDVAYHESAQAWIDNPLKNRAINTETDTVLIADMGEIGPEYVGRYQELVEEGNALREDFVFENFDDAPYYTVDEFLEANNLKDEIEEFLNTPTADLDIATNVEKSEV